ncbi:MAG TPA: glucosaminidase domain-containing protein [Sphingomonas sp.]
MSQPTYGIAITADDRTAKGVASAEKRIGGIPKRVDASNRASIGSSSRAVLRTFADTEKAGAKIFGGRSVMSGVTARMGAIGEAASAMGEGMGAAAAEGGILTGVLGGVGAAVAGAIGGLVALGVAAFDAASDWSKTAATIGRTSEIIGVGTKAIQEFTAAAERMGISKDKAMGGLGGLSQSLNDARYGRNTGVTGLLDYLGIKTQVGADGDVNVEGMLPEIADAFSRQSSAGKRRMAQILSIPLDTIAAFSQGGKSLSADMADTEKTGVVLSPEDIDLGKRQVRRNTIDSQIAQGKILTPLKRGITGGIDSAETWVMNKLGIGADTIDRAGGKMDRAGDKMGRAADRIAGSVVGSARPGLTPEAIRAAQESERKYGVPASVTLAQYGLESSFGRRMPGGRSSNNPFGIKARPGEPFVWSSTNEEINGRNHRVRAKFRVFDSLQDAFDAHARLLATGRYYKKARDALPNIDAYEDALGGSTPSNPTYATDSKYGPKLRGIERSNNLRQYNAGENAPNIPVDVTVKFENAPPGTRATVKAGKAANPAVSLAIAPVHGG